MANFEEITEKKLITRMMIIPDVMYIQDGVCNPPMIISRLGLLKPSVAWDNPHSPLWESSSLSLLVAIIKHRMVDTTSRKKKCLSLGSIIPLLQDVESPARNPQNLATRSFIQITGNNHGFPLFYLDWRVHSHQDDVPFRGKKDITGEGVMLDTLN